MELKELQQETCGLIRIRQAVYNRIKVPNFKPGDPQMLIQDCEMGDWVVGPCSSTCVDANGNPGIQLITRTLIQKWDPTTPEGKYGAGCPPDQVQRECANVPCPIDCVMADWSCWSKCSKDCGGGQQGRSRAVMTEAEYGGKECPANGEERLCNDGSCDVDCILGDGSGSLWYRWGPKDRNFKLVQKFTLDLIENSQLAKMDAQGRAKGGLRYGVILYSWSAQTISQISADKAALLTKVKGMKWPRGATMTGRALLHANVLFNMGGTKQRSQVIILVTDGRATNQARAMRSAYKVKKNGIRIILVPVKNAIGQKNIMCRWASKPCKENMIVTPSWKMLISKMRWYLTTMCPVVEAK